MAAKLQNDPARSLGSVIEHIHKKSPRSASISWVRSDLRSTLDIPMDYGITQDAASVVYVENTPWWEATSVCPTKSYKD